MHTHAPAPQRRSQVHDLRAFLDHEPPVVLAAGYLAAYVLLDWISFIHPFAPYGITPWNPPPGLSFVLVLLFGKWFIPCLFLAPVLADVLVRQLPFSWPVQVATAFVIGGGYSLTLLVLQRPALRLDPALPKLRDLVVLIAAAAASATIVALGYCTVLMIAGLLAPSELGAAVVRFWVGDVIGICVAAPFALLFVTRGRLLPMNRETMLQLIAIVCILFFVFGYAERHHFQLFYALFLPIIWLALRSGLEGVTVGLVVTQLGLIIGVQLAPQEQIDLTSFQALMIVLAMTGLAAGAFVTEHRRNELHLRLHQETLARLARLGSLGELATLVAHELNQPLMAAGTYARMVTENLRGSADASIWRDREETIDIAGKMVTQLDRAGDVLRRLRALVRRDKVGRAPAHVEHFVQETLKLCQPELYRHQVAVYVDLEPDLPLVMVDVLQIEQVLLNLLRNAMEAIAEDAPHSGKIQVEAARDCTDQVRICVRDNGPGFPGEWDDVGPPPFHSRKPEGLGIGLSLCRTIVESHGGRFEIGGSRTGAVVAFTLPLAGDENV
jgi:two-component system, LuxR family, sensor kinase FixL